MKRTSPDRSVSQSGLWHANRRPSVAITDNFPSVKVHLRHIAGHSTVTPFAVRLGGRADSDTQADCKASTTAKRNALLLALNIVIRQDCMQDEDDARMEGGFITPDQAADLKRRIKETKADEKKFLAFAGAETFELIRESKLEACDDALRKREAAKKKPAPDTGEERDADGNFKF